MATKSHITAEQYLHMTFEHDAEFVHGEIVERSMPDYIHGKIAFLIAQALVPVIRAHRLYPCFEVRMQVAPDVYRIPDASVFAGEEPKESVPFAPPLLVIEILSRDDRHHDLLEKLEDYRVWGVPNIWVVDPIAKRFSIYSERRLEYVSSLALADHPFELTQSNLFSDL
ncbi:MAG: Uma2 family endonuclease [Bryobacterales bacterium]|nr:Uma2 family endonuclease [Bryobacterales bacterium]